MEQDELSKAVRAALRYSQVGNLTNLREVSGLSGQGFTAFRRSRHSISRAAACRIARTFRTWAAQCTRRADRIAQALTQHGTDDYKETS